MLTSGFLGFLMSYLTGLQIHVTTPLSHNVSGCAKSCVQTLLSVFYFNEAKESIWWFGNIIVLTGSALYTHVKSCEMRDNYFKSQAKPQSNEKMKLLTSNSQAANV